MTKALWILTVNRLMKRDWCIDASDAGLDAAELTRHWRSGDAPDAFVAWFAEKYDLIRFEPQPIRRSLSSFPPSE